MSATCCHDAKPPSNDPGYRTVLWVVLGINAVMFVAELLLGFSAGSVSLQADALDFLGDAANYSISLLMSGLALHHRARATLLKGITMGGFGLWIFGSAVWHAGHGTLPAAMTMGKVGVVALLANALTFALLWKYRSGDSNMQSVWLCSRNDVIGNLAVLLAALGVFGTSRGWPDVLVALIMAGLAVQGSWTVTRAASRELSGVHA